MMTILVGRLATAVPSSFHVDYQLVATFRLKRVPEAAGCWRQK
jgi:hypothetical protein